MEVDVHGDEIIIYLYKHSLKELFQRKVIEEDFSKRDFSDGNEMRITVHWCQPENSKTNTEGEVYNDALEALLEASYMLREINSNELKDVDMEKIGEFEKVIRTKDYFIEVARQYF